MISEDLVDKTLVSCSTGTKLNEVIRLMKDKDVGSVVITEDERPIGIITDRDIVLRALSRNVDLSKTTASEVMSRNLELATPLSTIHEVIERMNKRHVRRIPVVDDLGKLLGMISFDDALLLVTKETAKLTDELTELSRATGLRKTKLHRSAA